MLAIIDPLAVVLLAILENRVLSHSMRFVIHEFSNVNVTVSFNQPSLATCLPVFPVAFVQIAISELLLASATALAISVPLPCVLRAVFQDCLGPVLKSLIERATQLSAHKRPEGLFERIHALDVVLKHLLIQRKFENVSLHHARLVQVARLLRCILGGLLNLVYRVKVVLLFCRRPGLEVKTLLSLFLVYFVTRSIDDPYCFGLHIAS